MKAFLLLMCGFCFLQVSFAQDESHAHAGVAPIPTRSLLDSAGVDAPRTAQPTLHRASTRPGGVHGAAAPRYPDSLSVRWLDEVKVTTAQYEPQSARNSVYNVRVIPMEAILARGAATLQDALNTELNMRFAQDGGIGNSRLSMQGISGQNIKILIDGAPLAGRQGINNEIDINQINVHTIERVEIVEGPMSTMYGADALAGVINIITKKVESGQWSVNAALLEKSVGNEYGWDQGVHNQNVGFNYAHGKWFAGVNASKNYFGGWRGTATGRDKSWNPKDQIAASFQGGYRPGAGQQVYYRLDYLHEYVYNPGPMLGIQITDEQYITDRFMHQVQGEYPILHNLRFLGIVSHTDYRRDKRTLVFNQNKGDWQPSLASGSQDQTRIDGTTLRGTFSYDNKKAIAAQLGLDINLDHGSGGRIANGRQSMQDYAIFGSVEWRLLPGLQLRPGFRFTYNSVYKAPPITPSFHVRWQIAERHDLRISYGRGFRAPSLRELYFDFFDSNHSIRGNTALRPETSHSVNLSWDWLALERGKVRWSFVLGGFYNAIDNKIELGVNPNSGSAFTYINIAKYQTHGFTLRSTLRTHQLTATLGASYTKYLFWSPEATAKISYHISKARIDLSLFYKYTGESPVFSAVGDVQLASALRSSPFHTADITVRKALPKGFSVMVGVQNVLDVKFTSNRSYGAAGAGASVGPHAPGASTPVGYGRSYMISVAYDLSRGIPLRSRKQ